MQFRDTVEFRPGPCLNVVVGPNGSGKSSLVNGIALALGSKVSYTQYGFIRNGVIRNSTEILRIFKERLLKFLGIRNIEKKLRNKLSKTTNFSQNLQIFPEIS